MVILFASSICDAQTGLEELRLRATENGDAIIRGDFNRVVDLTYPKLVELIGGRERMVSLLEKGRREMKAQGNEYISVSIHQPQELVTIGIRTFAIVPFSLKLKASGGTLVQEAFLIGISGDKGHAWTFIDGTNLDEEKLKALLPDAAGKIRLPEKQAPVFQKNL